MKRFYLLAWALILSLPVMAKNKISMVTYFPVPYVAYSQTSATGMDIGLSSTCDMKLGCTQSDVTLKATNAVNVTSGRLNLDGGLGVKGSSVVLGEGNKLGKITFNNARLQTANMNSVVVEENTAAQTLNLFGQKFPSCKAKDGKGKMSWKKLTLAGSDKSELYLVCGDGVASSTPTPCQPTNGGRETYTESCPSGQTGTVTYTWDYSACKYNKSSTCKEEKGCSDAAYKLSHKSECCPSAAKTDTDCYSEILEWKFVQGGILEGGDDCPQFQAGESKECTKKGETCELETSCQSVGVRDADRCFSSRYECAATGEYKQLW